MDMLGPRLRYIPLYGCHKGCGLPCHKCTATLADLHVKIESRSKDVLAQKTHLVRLLNGNAHVLHGQGILMPHIDVPLMGPDSVGADDHPF